MDGTRELVDAGQVGWVLAALSLIALLLAVALTLLGRQRGAPGLAKAGLIAAAVVTVYPLWAVYNGIEDYFGLDSVAALLLNLALFAAVGIGGGLLFRRLWPAERETVHHRDVESVEGSGG